jgi:hypothetical protein
MMSPRLAHIDQAISVEKQGRFAARFEVCCTVQRPLLGEQLVGWVEPFAIPITFKDEVDGYRFAPPILRAI